MMSGKYATVLWIGVVIVGGVAGEASCAARLCRLDEKIEILMVERGPCLVREVRAALLLVNR